MADGLQNYIIKNVADGTIVNTLVETITSSNLISANTVSVGSILTLFARVNRTTTTATVLFTVKVYINTSASLSGATLITTILTPTTANNLVDFGRIFVVKSSTNTQGFASSSYTGAFSRYQATAPSLTNSNIDWTVNQYLIISITLLSASEVALSNGCLLLKD